jgi:PAS domain S-box-containing protein
MTNAEMLFVEGEKSYRFLTRNLSDAVWTTDLDMRLTGGNPSLSQLMGCSIEEILGEKMTERLTPISQEAAANALDELREAAARPSDGAEETGPLTLDFICEHGRPVRTRAWTRLLRGSTGEPSGLLWVAQTTGAPERAGSGNRAPVPPDKDQPGERSQRIRAETALRATQRELEKTKAELAFVRKLGRRAEAKLDQLNCEWLCLQTSAATVASSLDLDLVLNTVTREMTKLLKADGCAIFRWDQHTDIISLVVDHTATPAARQREAGETYDLADHPRGWRTVVERRPQQVVVGELDEREFGYAYLRKDNIWSLLVLPMITQGRVVGFVEIRDCQEERAFTDRQTGLAQMLTTQATSAIANARLYEHTQEEITRRVGMEAELRKSLRDKEALLQEVHHRVKNNLQVICSLLNLKSESGKDPETVEILRDSQDRVRSMALIHEQLYQSQDLERVEFGSYLQDLASHLIRSYGTESARVRLTVAADDVPLSIAKAVPCGLIVNELVSNALKYAFPHERGGEISIALRAGPDQHLVLSVADDGIGLPADAGSGRAETLGLRLIQILTDQIDGTLSFSSAEGTGTQVRIVFPTS